MKLKLHSLKKPRNQLVKLFIAALFFTLPLANSPVLLAQEVVTVDGVIQGANCVHDNHGCPKDTIDSHISIERDFVLLMPNGEHYFLPNLDRAIKARYVTETARIRGEKDGHGIWVETLEIYKGGKFTQVWSLKEEQKLYQGTN